MLKTFLQSVIALAFLGTVCDMMMPENAVKKYFKLTFGFMMIFILINPLTKNINTTDFEFSFDEFMSNEEIKSTSDSYILKMHEENISNYVSEKTGCKSEQIFVELYSDGAVKSVAIRDAVVPYGIIADLKIELGCEKIYIYKDDTNAN